MSKPRRRLDAELVSRGLVSSRERAREAVELGRVMVNGAIADRPARMVLPGDAVVVLGPPDRYVGRGGEKLAGALAAFGLNPAGWRCCDVGASTGGFTDCLLQSGARSVVAIDVGRAQIHERLLADPRVTSLERTDIRDVHPEGIGGPFDLVTADVSFISLTSVMDSLAALVGPGDPLVVLIKPQFEVGRKEVSRSRGVISDPKLWGVALSRVLDAAHGIGISARDVAASNLFGAQGNVEFFAHLEKGGSLSVTKPSAVVAQALARYKSGLVSRDDSSNGELGW